MNDETRQQIGRAIDADNATPHRLYDHDSAPIFYPAGHFVRKLTMIRLGADGVPEVVGA